MKSEKNSKLENFKRRMHVRWLDFKQTIKLEWRSILLSLLIFLLTAAIGLMIGIFLGAVAAFNALIGA